MSIKTHGYHLRTIKFLDIASYKSIVEYKQRRFICHDCHKTFNEDTSFVEKGSTISNQTKVKLLERLRNKSSFTDIAQDLNISLTTAINEFSEHISDYRCKLTEVVCIDEFRASTICGEYALIIGDPISGTILDILPSRKQDYIYMYFQTIPDEDRLKVKYVVTDLFESYRTVVRNLFWKSIHIADRFHWIRLCTEAFNKIRIRIMNSYLKLGVDEFRGSYNKYTIYANVMKKYYKLLLANRYSKEEWFFNQKQIASYIKKEMTFQEIIEYCLNFDSDLEESYESLQDLHKLAKYSNHDNAKKNILEWCERIESSEHKIPELVKVALTYQSWIEPIVNSFVINETTKARMTNGFIEGKNNFCKVIKRIGFGYKDFDIFRAKILYSNDKSRPYKN
jgi:transposase